MVEKVSHRVAGSDHFREMKVRGSYTLFPSSEIETWYSTPPYPVVDASVRMIHSFSKSGMNKIMALNCSNIIS